MSIRRLVDNFHVCIHLQVFGGTGYSSLPYKGRVAVRNSTHPREGLSRILCFDRTTSVLDPDTETTLNRSHHPSLSDFRNSVQHPSSVYSKANFLRSVCCLPFDVLASREHVVESGTVPAVT